jgi:phenylalanyl-tRNA synthetase beta chain
VETLNPYYSVPGGLEGLVVGEVISAEPHPNAEKLKITQVNTGGKENLQIVCRASNVAATQKIVVDTVGTTIYPETR